MCISNAWYVGDGFRFRDPKPSNSRLRRLGSHGSIISWVFVIYSEAMACGYVGYLTGCAKHSDRTPSNMSPARQQGARFLRTQVSRRYLYAAIRTTRGFRQSYAKRESTLSISSVTSEQSKGKLVHLLSHKLYIALVLIYLTRNFDVYIGVTHHVVCSITGQRLIMSR